MLYTSAEAAKLLKEKKEAYEAILSKESIASAFDASIGEDVEGARPEYAYKETQDALRKLQSEMRTIKHAINRFNVQQEVPGFQMTVDQMLVYIPQLTEMKKSTTKCVQDFQSKGKEMTVICGQAIWWNTHMRIIRLKIRKGIIGKLRLHLQKHKRHWM